MWTLIYFQVDEVAECFEHRYHMYITHIRSDILHTDSAAPSRSLDNEGPLWVQQRPLIGLARLLVLNGLPDIGSGVRDPVALPITNSFLG